MDIENQISKLKTEADRLHKRQEKLNAEIRRTMERAWKISREIRKLELMKLQGISGAVKYGLPLEGKYSRWSAQPATLCEVKRTRCTLRFDDGTDKGFLLSFPVDDVKKIDEPMGMFLRLS